MKPALFFLTLCASTAIGQDRIGLHSTGVRHPSATVFFAGQYYKDARVESVSGDQAKIRGAENKTATVPISALPAILKSDAQAQAAATAATEARWKKALSTPNPEGAVIGQATVISVTKDGLIAQFRDHTILLQNHPASSNVADGETVKFKAIPGGIYKYVTTLGAHSSIRIYRVTEGQ